MGRFANERKFDGSIREWAVYYAVPAWVIQATIGKESSFDPQAYRQETADASRGLMQLLAATAAWLGYKGAVGDDASRTGGLFDPDISIMLGTKYLAKLRNRYPSVPWDEIYAAYNAGSIFKDADGNLTNEANVVGWRNLADYFNPGWNTPGGGLMSGP